MSTCTHPECAKPAYSMAKGQGPFCRMHCQRVQRYNNPDLVYQRHRNPMPQQGFVAGQCACGQPYVKPRYRV